MLVGMGLVVGFYLYSGGSLPDLLEDIRLSQGLIDDRDLLEQADTTLPGTAGELLNEGEYAFESLAEESGVAYQRPRRIVFLGRVVSECHDFESVAGPFYCFAAESLFLESAYFDELLTFSIDSGELAQAYVLGRLLGKHLQTRQGITDRVRQHELDVTPVERLREQTQLELQADYYAGVWAHHSARFRKLLETGSLEDALRAVQFVTREREKNCVEEGGIVAEKYDYATVEQRLRWFRLGLESGKLTEHDPFKTRIL